VLFLSTMQRPGQHPSKRLRAAGAVCSSSLGSRRTLSVTGLMADAYVRRCAF
jgi:hypothetical protein